MDRPTKQPFICSEVCVCCFRCEMTCPKGVIEHDDKNHDARHIRFNVGNRPVPALESQTLGVMPWGNRVTTLMANRITPDFILFQIHRMTNGQVLRICY